MPSRPLGHLHRVLPHPQDPHLRDNWGSQTCIARGHEWLVCEGLGVKFRQGAPSQLTKIKDAQDLSARDGL